jgi:hypothetical protein
MKNPTIKALAELIRAVKGSIAPEYRAFQEDEDPGVQLTVGADSNGDWSYQTGDNSYSGSAYRYPFWGVVGVYRRSNSVELAHEIKRQLEEQDGGW